MADFIVVIILLVIIGTAIAYIVREKKNGAKCVGCPLSGKCSGSTGGYSGCGGWSDTK